MICPFDKDKEIDCTPIEYYLIYGFDKGENDSRNLGVDSKGNPQPN